MLFFNYHRGQNRVISESKRAYW